VTIAEIHGKMPIAGSEDLLTASVFGAFRYLPAREGIIGFLRSLGGAAPAIPEPDEEDQCTVHFWPMGLLRRREPDVLLELSIGGRLWHVAGEAKYFSGPSDREDDELEHQGEVLRTGNQLADEYIDLCHGHYEVYDGSWRGRKIVLESPLEHRLLLYLTAHIFPPQDDLKRSISYIPDLGGRLLWSSWYDVWSYLDTTAAQLGRFPYDRIVRDLLALLRKKGFSIYEGITLPPNLDVADLGGAFWRWFAPLPDIPPDASGAFWFGDSDVN
jgi:hypothetical protein